MKYSSFAFSSWFRWDGESGTWPLSSVSVPHHTRYATRFSRGAATRTKVGDPTLTNPTIPPQPLPQKSLFTCRRIIRRTPIPFFQEVITLFATPCRVHPPSPPAEPLLSFRTYTRPKKSCKAQVSMRSTSGTVEIPLRQVAGIQAYSTANTVIGHAEVGQHNKWTHGQWLTRPFP